MPEGLDKTRPSGAASCLFFSALLALAPAAEAAPWLDFGPRAMGMGGAGVALAQGPEAAYWNPAGLGQLYDDPGVGLTLGLQREVGGPGLRGANDLFQLHELCKTGSPLCTSAALSQAFRDMDDPANGALAGVAGGIALKHGRFAFFALHETYAGATPRVDRTNTCPGAGCLDGNASSLVLRGGSFYELGAGIGHELKETGLIVGASLKGIVGKVGYNEFRVVTQEPGSGKLGKFKDEGRVSFMPAVDLGLLWDLRETWPGMKGRPRVGLSARNVNCPTFAQPAAAKAAGETERYALQGQARLGGALSPADAWVLAADLDLTENNTESDGFKSRLFSLGTELALVDAEDFRLPLRFGLKKNLAARASALALTAGIGMEFLHCQFDVAGQVSPGRVDSRSIGGASSLASNLGLSGRFGVLFGGEERPQRRRKTED